MQVFNAFFKVAKKHLTQVAIYVSIFLILVGIMSLSDTNTQATKFSADSVNITIIDKDNSSLSNGIHDFLAARHNIVKLKNTDKETLTDNLFYQKISYVLIIPNGFEESFLSDSDEKLTLSHNMRKDSASGFFVNNQIDSFVNSVHLYCVAGYDINDAISATQKNLDNSPEVSSIKFDDTSKNSNDTMFRYFQYMGYVLMMIFALSLVPILMTFQQRDLNARIMCSSTSARSRNIQIGLGCICYSIIIWSFFILLAIVWFRPANVLSQQGLFCILNSFVFSLVCTAMTLLLSTFKLNDNSLNLIANILGIGMSFLCGIFVPQWMLSDKVLAAGKFLPAYWYVKVINMVTGWSGEKYSVHNYWVYIGIELIFLVAIFSIYLVAHKQRKKASIA